MLHGLKVIEKNQLKLTPITCLFIKKERAKRKKKEVKNEIDVNKSGKCLQLKPEAPQF